MWKFTAVGVCMLLLLASTGTEGLSIKGEVVTDENAGRLFSRHRDGQSQSSGDSLRYQCRRLNQWCWSDWDCCSTWCNGYCYCLYYNEGCYYDYECCTGWCDRYYGCIYPYGHLQKEGAAAAQEHRGEKVQAQ